jgi:hypothetical protein
MKSLLYHTSLFMKATMSLGTGLLAMSALLFSAACFPAGPPPIESTGDSETDIGIVYGSIVGQGVMRDFCTEQFPDMKIALDAALAGWRRQYEPFIKEIESRIDKMIVGYARESNVSPAEARKSLSDAMAGVVEFERKFLLAKDLPARQSLCEGFRND